MSTIELKQKLIKKLEFVNEDHLLEEILALIEFQNNAEPYKLSTEQKEAVDEAREQIRNGEYYTNEEVDQEIDEWLNA